jgi:CheY-like chemotaxis protein
MSLKKKSEDNQVEILVVEDSPTQAERLRYILEMEGYQVTVARNGKEALSLLSEHRPTAVISDIVMP